MCRSSPWSATVRPERRCARSSRGAALAEVVAIGPSDVAGASIRLATPAVDERYAPLLDILPLQRLALALALGRGEDPDAPRGLAKVTVTR
jgi:glucosamine--fructose-6-phosphate aminotransferase (isomerizing)